MQQRRREEREANIPAISANTTEEKKKASVCTGNTQNDLNDITYYNGNKKGHYANKYLGSLKKSKN